MCMFLCTDSMSGYNYDYYDVPTCSDKNSNTNKMSLLPPLPNVHPIRNITLTDTSAMSCHVHSSLISTNTLNHYSVECIMTAHKRGTQTPLALSSQRLGKPIRTSFKFIKRKPRKTRAYTISPFAVVRCENSRVFLVLLFMCSYTTPSLRFFSFLCGEHHHIRPDFVCIFSSNFSISFYSVDFSIRPTLAPEFEPLLAVTRTYYKCVHTGTLRTA